MAKRADVFAAHLELLKGAAANPHFDPFDREKWDALLACTAKAAEKLCEEHKPDKSTGAHIL